MNADAKDFSPPLNQTDTSVGPASTDASMRTIVLVVHGLNALGMLTVFTPLVGVILAYVKRDDARGTIYESHLTYAIRTFWIGVGLVVAGVVLTFVLVGTILLAFSMVWYLIRVVRAFVAVFDGRAIANPKGFF